MNNTKTEAQPIYFVISADIREQIFRGDLNPGDLLPSENELCARYGVSRETVRKALKKIETETLIFSRPKRGYFVSDPNHNEFTLTFSEDLKNCQSKYKDIRGILPEKDIQAALNIPPDRKVIEFSRVTYDGDIPVAYDVKYMPYDKAYPLVESEIRYAVFPEMAAAKVSPFDFYTTMDIRAVKAKGKPAKMLECDENEPLLLITRSFIRRSGQIIGHSKHYVKQPYGLLHGRAGYPFDQP
jgi:GntR family transcriptional regulator